MLQNFDFYVCKLHNSCVLCFVLVTHLATFISYVFFIILRILKPRSLAQVTNGAIPSGSHISYRQIAVQVSRKLPKKRNPYNRRKGNIVLLFGKWRQNKYLKRQDIYFQPTLPYVNTSMNPPKAREQLTYSSLHSWSQQLNCLLHCTIGRIMNA